MQVSVIQEGEGDNKKEEKKRKKEGWLNTRPTRNYITINYRLTHGWLVDHTPTAKRVAQDEEWMGTYMKTKAIREP